MRVSVHSGGPLGQGEMPSPAEAAAGELEWRPAAEAASPRPGTVRKIDFGHVTVALLCGREGVFALENAGAHEGGSLGDGSVEGEAVTCPLHNKTSACRIRVPGGEMTSEQARAVAYLAYGSGYSLVDVTTRGNLQVQGLAVSDFPALFASLERVGLTSQPSGHDNLRNVTSHPWSGIDPQELINTRGLARHIRDMIVGNGELSDLPRKLNVALTGRADPAAHAWTQDLSYVATRRTDGSVGFQLLLGGREGQSPKLAARIPVFVRPDQVLEVTHATLRTFRELDGRTNRHQVRMGYLIERIGADGVLVEIEKRLGYALARFFMALPAPAAEETFMGWFKQKQDDLWAVGVGVPVGGLTAYELEGLAAVARQHGDGTLRTTYHQNIVIPGIRTAATAAAGHAIARHGLTFEPGAAVRGPG